MLDTREADPKVEELLLQILECVGDTKNSSAPADEVDAQQVVLEMSVNGNRYILSRTSIQLSQPQSCLSPREKEIVRLVAKGLANKAIAAVLDVSPWTVATHLRRVFSKLGVGSRAEMIARVLEGSLLDGD